MPEFLIRSARILLVSQIQGGDCPPCPPVRYASDKSKQVECGRKSAGKEKADMRSDRYWSKIASISWSTPAASVTYYATPETTAIGTMQCVTSADADKSCRTDASRHHTTTMPANSRLRLLILRLSTSSKTS